LEKLDRAIKNGLDESKNDMPFHIGEVKEAFDKATFEKR